MVDKSLNKSGKKFDVLMDTVNSSPIYQFLRLKVLIIQDGYSKLELDCGDNLLNVQNTIHGGILATVLDSCCGVAVASLISPNEKPPTIEIQVKYISPAHKGLLVGEATASYTGGRICFAEGQITDGNNRLIAKCSSTHYIRTKHGAQ